MRASKPSSFRKAFVGLGSNLGDRLRYCSEALIALRKTPGIILRRYSRVYLTPPVGFSSPNWFYNLACELETALSPQALLFRLWQIEARFGRRRKGKITDRTLDLDLLLYEGFCAQGSILSVPHPRLHERAFVLFPLAELIPHEKHPILKKSFSSLLAALPPEEKRNIKALSLLPCLD